MVQLDSNCEGLITSIVSKATINFNKGIHSPSSSTIGRYVANRSSNQSWNKHLVQQREGMLWQTKFLETNEDYYGKNCNCHIQSCLVIDSNLSIYCSKQIFSRTSHHAIPFLQLQVSLDYT